MPNRVDIHVGQKLRQRRWLVGMSQQELAAMVGIKFQQIQKYETGANRVSASRLWDIAEALNVTATHFFEGMENAADTKVENPEGKTKTPADLLNYDLLNYKEAMNLVRSYYAIP